MNVYIQIGVLYVTCAHLAHTSTFHKTANVKTIYMNFSVSVSLPIQNLYCNQNEK